MSKKKRSTEAAAATNKTTAKSNQTYVYLNHPQGIMFDLPNGKKLEISGSNSELKGKPMGVLDTGVYGCTVIDISEWEYIKKNYGSMQIFKTGLIFADEKKETGDEKADEQATLETGLEAVNPEDAGVTDAGKPKEDEE